MAATVKVMAANYNADPVRYYRVGVKAPNASSFSWCGDPSSFSTRFASCSVPDEYCMNGECLVDINLNGSTKRMWVKPMSVGANIYDDFYGNVYNAGLEVNITGGIKGNIFVDGVQKGTNVSSVNIQLNAGSHTVKVLASGYRTYTTTISIASGTVAKVNAALDLPMGRAYIKTKPTGALLSVV